MKQLITTICAVFLASGCVVGEGDPSYDFQGSLSVDVANDAPVASTSDSDFVVLSDATGASRTNLVITVQRVDLDADLVAEVQIIEGSALAEPSSEPLIVPLLANNRGERVGHLTLEGDSAGTIRVETTVFDQTVSTVVDVQPLSRHLTLEWLALGSWGCYELGLAQEQEIEPRIRIEAPARNAPETVEWTVTGPAILEQPVTRVDSRNRSLRSIGGTDARIILPPNLTAETATSVTITATAGGLTIQEVVSAAGDCQAP